MDSLRGTGGVEAPARWAEAVLILAVLLLSVSRLAPRAPPGPPPSLEEVTHRVDLNRAAWFELVDLPGIGEARAREIVRDRDARGPFRGVADLLRVRGIGPATVAEIEAFVTGGTR